MSIFINWFGSTVLSCFYSFSAAKPVFSPMLWCKLVALEWGPLIVVFLFFSYANLKSYPLLLASLFEYLLFFLQCVYLLYFYLYVSSSCCLPLLFLLTCLCSPNSRVFIMIDILPYLYMNIKAYKHIIG